MWTRADLKSRAKMTLKGHYWTAFVASLVLAFVSGGRGSSGGTVGFEFGSSSEAMSPEYTAGVAVGVIIALAAGLAVAIFLGSVLEVGVRRYFTSACCRQYDLGNLGFAFKQGRYGNVVKVQLIRGIKEFLWFLVFFVPGIIKGLAWCLVPYILADNPYLNHKRALQLSNQMTMGHKLEIFALELSFIGWYLLGALCCGVGVAFVNPYHDSTMAELYMQLRHEALQRGDTTMAELCLSYN